MVSKGAAVIPQSRRRYYSNENLREKSKNTFSLHNLHLLDTVAESESKQGPYILRVCVCDER